MGLNCTSSIRQDEIQFLDTTIEKMVRTKRWQQPLQKYMWKDFYKDSSETSKFLEEQGKMYETLMKVNEEE